MKKNLIYTIFALFIFIGSASAQRHELGLQMGTSNLVGDIGRANYVLQKPMSNISENVLPLYAGVIYRMNFNPYQTVRLNLGYNHIQFDDKYAKEDYRRMRMLRGTNSLFSADLVFEYNFLPVNAEQKSMISPYIFGGLSALYMSAATPELNIISPSLVEVNYLQNKTFTMAIPFGVGLKYKFNYNWALSGEFTFRPTFSDQVDYSMLKTKNVKVRETSLDDAGTAAVVQDFVNKRTIGNPNSKDWINSATLILSYSFGRPPCYCK